MALLSNLKCIFLAHLTVGFMKEQGFQIIFCAQPLFLLMLGMCTCSSMGRLKNASIDHNALIESCMYV